MRTWNKAFHQRWPTPIVWLFQGNVQTTNWKEWRLVEGRKRTKENGDRNLVRYRWMLWPIQNGYWPLLSSKTCTNKRLWPNCVCDYGQFRSCWTEENSWCRADMIATHPYIRDDAKEWRKEPCVFLTISINIPRLLNLFCSFVTKETNRSLCKLLIFKTY